MPGLVASSWESGELTEQQHAALIAYTQAGARDARCSAYAPDKLQGRLHSSGLANSACSALAEALSLPNSRCETRQAVVLDYFCAAADFAAAQGFGPEQTACIHSLAQKLLQQAAGGMWGQCLAASVHAVYWKASSVGQREA